MNNKNNYQITPSLRQGEKYNSYQKKKGKTFNKSSSWVEGFTSQFNPFSQTSNQDKLTKTQLTQQTKDVLNETQTILNDSNSSLSELKQIYQDTLTKYNNLMKEVNGESTNYVTRVSSKNPYLNKVVRFTSGHICYVTNQGVVKYIPTMEVWQGLIDNGCGSYNYIELGIPFLDTYWTPGTPIATNPQLISGTTMTLGQGCGNEGLNVFVNKSVTNPSTTYLGCYNNLQPITYVQFSPTTMTSTNSINGYTTNASSIYQNNNDFAGPWCAFDGNVNTWWHTVEESGYLYNDTTGLYEGDNSVPYTDSTGTLQTVKGEFLQLNLPSATVLTKYELHGRPGMPERDPNTWYILGANVGWSLVDYQSNVSLNGQLTSFTIPNTTAYSNYIILVTKVGSPSSTSDRRLLQIATWNLYTSNVTSSNNPAMTQASSDYVSYNQCSRYASENGYNTFALQNAQSDGTGLCMVSNDSTQPRMYGEALGYSVSNLWSSNTNNGVSAVLNNYGSLQVLNSSNAAVYSSPATDATPANYLGCYQDGGTRALPTVVDNYAFNYDLSSCSQEASSGGYQYFGIQAYGWTGGGGQCFLGNDPSQATSYGKASNCQTLSDGTPAGGGWSNAVYSVNPSTGSNYCLVLQDDGNMCIFRGTGPMDNQGLIWATNMDSWGKNKEPNPLFSATKGKTGVNYMVSGETLNVNEFIGSTDGSMYLMMMPGGDLQLNTTTKSSSCSTYSGKNVGGQNSNAVYTFVQPAIKSLMGQVGFIDEDSVLYTYPSTNVKYTNDYVEINNMNSGGIDDDIPGAAFSNANVDQCKNYCNQNAECAGFAFDNQNNVCYPKTNQMYPVGPTQIQTGISIYTRNKSPIEPPVGSSDTIKSIDSVQYNSYTKSSSPPPTSTGLANATSYQKQQLSQLQDQLNMLSASITNYTNQFTNESININNQSTKNAAGLNDYLDNMEQTTIDIHTEKRNLSSIDNIEKQVNIQTLQQNYQYMFWTILAGAMILIIINMKKSITPK